MKKLLYGLLMVLLVSCSRQPLSPPNARDIPFNGKCYVDYAAASFATDGKDVYVFVKAEEKHGATTTSEIWYLLGTQKEFMRDLRSMMFTNDCPHFLPR